MNLYWCAIQFMQTTAEYAATESFANYICNEHSLSEARVEFVAEQRDKQIDEQIALFLVIEKRGYEYAHAKFLGC